jgi:endonuclease/exonuclease/phosphatase family metal-dependent hydrolase
VADAQALYGTDSALPVILTGDMYVGQSHSSEESGYKYLVANGYADSQRSAKLNANENIQHGTFHVIGEVQTNRISEDFVWYTDEIEALAFKVIATQDTADTSDHYPVIADLSFK